MITMPIETIKYDPRKYNLTPQQFLCSQRTNHIVLRFSLNYKYVSEIRINSSIN